MSRALGVHCRKDEVLLAIADDGALVDDRDHEIVRAPALLEATEALGATLSDLKRVLAEVQPDSVRVLRPFPTYEDSYPRMVPRITLETLVCLACGERDVPIELLYPNSATARVGVPAGGKLDEQIDERIEAVGRYWSRGRRRAALAALADRQ